MKTIFQIPSYGRQDKPLTVSLLTEMGYDRKDIWVGVDDEAQRAVYEPAMGDMATVMCCDSVNCAQARAYMLARAEPGTRVVTLDDDIRAFSRWRDEKTLEPMTTKEEFDKALDNAFSFAQAHNAPIWGGYPVVNPYFMSNTIDLRNVTLCTFMGILTEPGLQFDPEFIVKEDYELCLRVMNAGRNCVRYNFLVAEATHHTPGGAMRYWQTDQDRIFTERLCQMYPNLISPSKNASGFRFLKPVRYSINGPKKRRCRCPTNARQGTARPGGPGRSPIARCP